MLGLTHSAAGIMHGAYDEDDIQRAARGRLAFDPSQAIELRNALLSRMGAGVSDIVADRQ